MEIALMIWLFIVAVALTAYLVHFIFYCNKMQKKHEDKYKEMEKSHMEFLTLCREERMGMTREYVTAVNELVKVINELITTYKINDQRKNVYCKSLDDRKSSDNSGAIT